MGGTNSLAHTPFPLATTGRQQLSRATEEYSSPRAIVQRNPSFRSANDSGNSSNLSRTTVRPGFNPLAAALGGMSDQDILEYMNARKDDGRQQPRKSSRSSGKGSRRSNTERAAARVDDDHHYAASEPAANHIEQEMKKVSLRQGHVGKEKVMPPRALTACHSTILPSPSRILPTPRPRTQKPQRRNSASKLGDYLQKVLGTGANPTVVDLENGVEMTKTTTGSEVGSMGSHFG